MNPTNSEAMTFGLKAGALVCTSFIPGQTTLTKWWLKNQLKQNQWQHVCVTYNGQAANSVEIYVNGKKQDKGNPHHTLKKSSIRTDKPFHIGRRFKTAQLNDTDIDDVRVYNRALMEKEVAEVMELSYRFIPEPKGLVSSIDFNSFEGNQTKDSANGRDSYVINGKAKQTELGQSRFRF